VVDAILPGRYVVGVNARSGPRLISPYPATYFPGVSRRDASVVEIGEGERKTGFIIVVSPLAETTVSGVAVFDDDRPVVEATVVAMPIDQKGMIMSASTTDASGGFELRLLTGVSYLIRAETRTEGGLRRAETVIFVDEQKEGIRIPFSSVKGND
jgi:hypothetical protein